MSLLTNSFNPTTVQSLMCRTTLSSSEDGRTPARRHPKSLLAPVQKQEARGSQAD